MKFSLLYWAMRPWVLATLHGFYSRYSINNKEKLPKDAPIILAPNHQNAFMDPIGLSAKIKPQTSFLVRADVFKSKPVAKLLHTLKLMPIYRQRDGAGALEKNEAIFDYCYDLLKAHQAIILFPEGNHNNKKMLRPLKKGASRIAFGAEVKYDFKVGVQVVPVGLNYSNHTDMGAEMLVNIGDPINVQDYYELYKENEPRALLALKDELHARMGALILNIQVAELYDTINELHPICRSMMKEKMQLPAAYDQVNNFKADQQVIKAVEAKYAENPAETEDLKAEVAEYAAGLKKHNFRDHLFTEERHKGMLWQGLFLLLLSPMWLYGLINNYLPFKLPGVIVEKKIKDVHFHSSIKLAAGMFLFPIFWGIQLVIACLLLPHWELELLYFFTLPISGRFALDYWRQFKKFRARMKYNSMRNTPALKRLQALRASIIDRASAMADQTL